MRSPPSTMNPIGDAAQLVSAIPQKFSDLKEKQTRAEEELNRLDEEIETVRSTLKNVKSSTRPGCSALGLTQSINGNMERIAAIGRGIASDYAEMEKIF